MVIGNGPEKMLKTAHGMFLVKLQTPDVVHTRYRSGCAAAGENGFRTPLAGFDNLMFKKRYRQKRYRVKGMNFISLYPQIPDKTSVYRVMGCLKTKYLQSNIFEGVVVYCIYLSVKTFKSIQAFYVI
jgi:hypothetical protein